MDSTFSYQSFRGLTRSLAVTPSTSRMVSKVYLTSLEVKGWPSCHFTSFLREKARLFPPSSHDHFSASSGIMVSRPSCFFRGSKSSRLLYYVITGHIAQNVGAPEL